MKNLVLKDVYALQSYMKTVGMMLVFFAVVTYSMDDPAFLAGMVILLTAMMPVTTFAYDQQAKWDTYSFTLPVSQKQLVGAKYALSFLLIVAGISLATMLNVVIMSIKGIELHMRSIVINNVSIGAIALLFLCVLLPLIYRFGVEKSRLLMMVLVAIPSILFITFNKMGIALPAVTVSSTVVAVGALVVVTAATVASYYMSLRIYAKKQW